MNIKNYLIIFIIICLLPSIALFGMENNPNQQDQEQNNPPQQGLPQQQANAFNIKSEFTFPGQAFPVEMADYMKAKTAAIKARNALTSRIADNTISGLSSGFGQGIGQGIGTTIAEFNKPIVKEIQNKIFGRSDAEKLSELALKMDVTTKYVDGVGQAIVVEMKYGKPNQENLKKLEENRKKLVSVNTDLINKFAEELHKQDLRKEQVREARKKSIFTQIKTYFYSKKKPSQTKSSQLNKNAQKPMGNQPLQQPQPGQTPKNNIPIAQAKGPLQPNPIPGPKPQPGNNKK